jgi:glycosyltransferase involved in cell wall biosynthesis
MEIKRLRKTIGALEYPKINLYSELLPEESIPGFINSCDCFVSPSCGEGFGLPHLYSMSCEKPIISINWSSCSDYMTEENSLALQYEVKPVPYSIVRQDENFYGHQWAYPSLEHLGLLMKWVVDNQDECKVIRRKARETVIEKYSYSVVQNLMNNFLKERGLV